MARAGGALAFSQQEQGPGRPAPERNSIKDLVSLEEDQASDETCQANTQTTPGEAQGRVPGQHAPASCSWKLYSTQQSCLQLLGL